MNLEPHSYCGILCNPSVLKFWEWRHLQHLRDWRYLQIRKSEMEISPTLEIISNFGDLENVCWRLLGRPASLSDHFRVISGGFWTFRNAKTTLSRLGARNQITIIWPAKPQIIHDRSVLSFLIHQKWSGRDPGRPRRRQGRPGISENNLSTTFHFCFLFSIYVSTLWDPERWHRTLHSDRDILIPLALRFFGTN